jgi:gamma-glutamylputrescine oxidase
MHMQSYWERTAFWQELDAVVVGGGLVGLQGAIYLKEQRPHWRVVVLEQMVGSLGASTRNAGFACFGSMTELIEDLQHHPADEVWQLVEMRWRGLRHLRATLGDTAIGYQSKGGLEIFTPADTADHEQCLAQLRSFNQTLRSIIGHDEVFLPADERIRALGLGQTQHLIINQAEGQLHPGKLMRRLMAQARHLDVEYWTGLALSALEAHTDHVELHTTQGWSVQARRGLVATNGFAQRLLPSLPVQPARNQVLLTDPIPGLRLSGAFHYDRGYVYFRDVDGRVLIGGARNLDPQAETTDAFGHSARIQARLQEILSTIILPGQRVPIAQRWSGILGVGSQKSPLIRAIHPHLVAAVRLGGMGVAIGGEIGRQAAKLLLEEA